MSKKGYIFAKEDVDIWSEAIKDVKRLKERTLAVSNIKADITINNRRNTIPQVPVLKGQQNYVLKLGDATKINHSMLRTISKGNYKIDSSIDLHGHTKELAYHQLMTFLEDGCARKYRLLLVITGKGNSSPQNYSVLKNSIMDWLTMSRFNEYILCISYAHYKHGGDGAFYIVLKR
ncbi:Smr/MutS family protein [Candidatus Bandiella euplotis]|uniref:MutS-like SmrA family DNA endonuclease n=1 Tax=Candidatus Bandiella euplotis TaxID=1664265 RepID=A0ABZ0UK69_9RICK|nr:Smr/MutS family protein [Candidatus Bandiella woodruffii]WPX96491.1 MutS-like SmrA family DNA endonuclease [Candidatus Bandiella woodruffii]